LDIPAVTKVVTIKQIKEEAKKNSEVKKYLNRFDLVLIDDRISLVKAAKDLGGHTAFLRKKHFPFPVRITGVDAN